MPEGSKSPKAAKMPEGGKMPEGSKSPKATKARRQQKMSEGVQNCAKAPPTYINASANLMPSQNGRLCSRGVIPKFA